MITILQTPASSRKRALDCQKVFLFDKVVFAELNARFHRKRAFILFCAFYSAPVMRSSRQEPGPKRASIACR